MKATQHPKPPAPCTHEHLRFSAGAFCLNCIDCGQQWLGVVKGTWTFNVQLQSVPMYPPHDTRHDAWVIARTEPLAKK